MVNQKLGFITVAICFGYITTLTGLYGQFVILLKFKLTPSQYHSAFVTNITVKLGAVCGMGAGR